jgi:hypothetical protein
MHRTAVKSQSTLKRYSLACGAGELWPSLEETYEHLSSSRPGSASEGHQQENGLVIRRTYTASRGYVFGDRSRKEKVRKRDATVMKLSVGTVFAAAQTNSIAEKITQLAA